MKKRWKGLCALWMVLVLVIGAFPVAGASEDVPESAAVAVGEAAGDGGEQMLADSGTEESSVEDGTEKDPEQSTESEETENDGVTAGSSEAISEESERESEKSEESDFGGETSSEDSSLGESSLEEDSQEEILETTDVELLENAALPLKAAAREAAVSGDGWLYADSGQVESGMNVGGIGEGDSSIKKKVTIQFDKSFDSQGWIEVPTGKRLKAWKLWAFDENGNVTKELRELEAAGQISTEGYQNLNIDGSTTFLLIVPLWINAEDILDGDSLVMNAGDSCNLSEGTWQVDGDTTIYTIGTGGHTAYAAKSGTFTFHKTQ